MAKAKTHYVCQSCGDQTPRWAGKCPSCDEWNTLIEERAPARATLKARSSNSSRSLTAGAIARPITEISRSAMERRETGLDEFDRILGGGVVPGAVTLIGGEPGIGKSTLLLQVTGLLSGAGERALYISGEEAAEQTRLRAERLGTLVDDLYVAAETSLDAIIASIEEMRPAVVVIDSIQAIFSEDLTSATGSIAQVRECATRLTRLAKDLHIPVFMVGHVTKSGAVAGPRVLEHMVDTVLYFEGESDHAYRVLRAVKNRFGSTNEIGVFEMREDGLVAVDNPSGVFLQERPADTAGSVVTTAMEGSRPVMIEIQALLTPNGGFGAPRRSVSGVDGRRVALLAAVLEKRIGARMTQQDAFVNIPGGLSITETAVDLAILVAMVSSLRNRPIGPEWAIIGEVGLAGEIRSVGQFDRRLTEAARMGFTHCLTGRVSGRGSINGVKVLSARNVKHALELIGL